MVPLLASSAWPTVIAALIGAAAAIGGGAFSQWFIWQKERQAVAAALAAEIQGFVDVTDWRQARERIPQGYKFAIDDHPFPVFEGKIGKLGLLPADLASKVAGFYSYARGIVQDFRTLHSEDPARWAPGQDKEFRERLVEGIDTVKTKAEVLVPELKKEAVRRWQGYLRP
jgi:hypothetical protein